MDWSHGHNGTIHNGISRIGFYTGGHAARFRDEDLADKWAEKSEEWIAANKDQPFFLYFRLARYSCASHAARAVPWEIRNGVPRRCDCSVRLERGRIRTDPERAGLGGKHADRLLLR